MASLHLDDPAPDFTAPTTEGDISFLSWKGHSWAVSMATLLDRNRRWSELDSARRIRP